MKTPIKAIFLLALGLLVCFPSVAQEATQADSLWISGQLVDGHSTEPLPMATVQVAGTIRGTSTNDRGHFQLHILSSDTIIFRYVGYEALRIPADELQGIGIIISLFPATITTEEVVITGERKGLVESTEMGQHRMNIEKIASIPAFLGEVDVMRSMQLLPGVQSAGEGNSGLYVRGGSPDQNLILMDRATVYNASHLLGFFSVFNADAVEDVNLIKGGMPARFGNRLASVLEVGSRKGNMVRWKSQGGVGLISSRFLLEGPLVKNKVSVLLAARRTYLDALADPFIPESSAAKGSGYYFMDLNGSVAYRIDDQNQISASFFLGQDRFKYVNRNSGLNVRIPWGNRIAQVEWSHWYHSNLRGSAYAFYSHYDFSFHSRFDRIRASFFSGIEEWSGGYDLVYTPDNRHLVRTGMQYSWHHFVPTAVSAQSGDTEFNTGDAQTIRAGIMGLYASDEWTISPKWKVYGGLRYASFSQYGPFTRYYPGVEGAGTTTKKVPDGKRIVTYDGLEPRFRLRYRLGNNWSAKTAYTFNRQFLHLASFSSITLPTDLWIPSTSRIQPQRGYQYSAGLFKDWPERNWTFSAEVYWKTMNNSIAYREGASPEDNVNNNIDNNLITGSGESKGIELFLKRTKGRWTGWIGYTLSRTTQRFADLNEGNPFPAKYDRTHDLSLVADYAISKRWSGGFTFVYATGNAFTLPNQRYLAFSEGTFLPVYGNINDFRMPAYHRADISLRYRKSLDEQEGKKWRSSWTFAVYNVYSRLNGYFIYIDPEGGLNNNSLQAKAKQVSIFPILPSVTWNFEF